MFGEAHSETKVSFDHKNDPIPPSTLETDLMRMFNDSRHCDYKVICGKTHFRVHRCVLASRSNVFSAMFEHSHMKEAAGSVEIKDVTAEAMKALLEFIYTDTCPSLTRDPSLAEDVLIAAEKYCMDRLKLKCEVMLCEVSNYRYLPW